MKEKEQFSQRLNKDLFLRECPKCGKNAEIEKASFEHGKSIYRIVCSDKNCIGQLTWSEYVEDKTNEWNYRPLMME